MEYFNIAMFGFFKCWTEDTPKYYRGRSFKFKDFVNERTPLLKGDVGNYSSVGCSNRRARLTDRRSFYKPFCKLEEMMQNGIRINVATFLRKHLKRRKWKAPVFAQCFLPAFISKLKSVAKLRRSPQRKMGLQDALQRGARIRSFTLQEALIESYTRDIRVCLVLTMLMGGLLWFTMVPDELFNQPQTVLSAEAARAVVDTKQCISDFAEGGCPHSGVHNEISNYFLKDEHPFDPLNTSSRKKAMGFAVLIGFLLLAVSTTESITTDGIGIY